MDWVDRVADDIFFDAINSQDFLAFGDSDDLWETVSAASVEDLDHADAIDMSQYLIADGSVEATQVSSGEMRPMTSPSRSSTPSRSVRNRRRVIGAARPMTPGASSETVWDSAAFCQFKISSQAQIGVAQNVPTMKRQESAPAMLLDLNLEPFPSSIGCGGKQTPASKSSISAMAMDLGGDAAQACASPLLGRSERQTPISSLSGVTIGKSKSTGTLHGTSLGISWSTSSPKQGGKGVLPVLSDFENNRKTQLIAWSMNMAKTKRGGMRSVF
jgi:hypothetical protein